MLIIDPRQSAEFIAKNALDVTINRENVFKVADMLTDVFRKNEYKLSAWKEHELHPKAMNDFTVNWIFLADTLNFSFWGEENKKFGVKYNGKLFTGYWSLHAAIRRALEEGIPITDASYYAKIKKKDFDYFLRSDTDVSIPLLEERYRIVHETGEILNKKFNSCFTNCVNTCDQSAVKLMDLIVNNFPSYKDEAEFNDKKVSFYKRAQILIADIWACFEGKNQGSFKDIESLTIFADYRIPQLLAHFGVIEYSDELKNKLKQGELMKNGERQEIELRGCSIAAVEMITDRIKSNLQNEGSVLVNSCIIDFYLWDHQQNHRTEVDLTPFHKVRCIYY